MWRKGNLYTMLLSMEIGAATVRTVWRILKKLKVELSYDIAILLLWIYLKKKNSDSKRYMHFNVNNGTIYSNQDAEGT